jgi:CHAD domain-containing protein
LHELRIECKKLRYLLASFRSLFSPEAIAPPLQALEELQEALGRANDARVQSQILQDLAERLYAAGRAPAACLIGTGRLLEELARRHARAAQDSVRLFRSFASRKEKFETLLPPPEETR